jgi:short-subunit dehydrogenase
VTRFQQRYGSWALVTGAANGLGAEFAQQIAARGLHVVLVDVDADGLARTAHEIQQRTGQQTQTLALDLTHAESSEAIMAATQNLDIGLLINNAGITTIGHFVDKPVQDHLRVINLNIRTPLLLTHAYASRFVARKRGGVLFVSSLSGVQGTAYVANYAATKAYNLILAEGLWQELRGHGVDVMACLVGTTRTPAFALSQPRLDRAGPIPIMEMAPTVSEALDALGRGPSVVVGRLNRFIAFILQRLLPRRWVIQLVSDTMHKMYGPQ